jgi:hypothetical protein
MKLRKSSKSMLPRNNNCPIQVFASHHQQSDSESIEAELKFGAKYWGPILDIPYETVTTLVARLLGYRYSTECSVHEQRRGASNSIWVVRFPSNEMAVLKVPYTGWTIRWTDQDAEVLRSEALYLRYIHQFCNAPVPELLAYDTSFDSEIGTPFALMSQLKGIQSNKLWSKQDGPIPHGKLRKTFSRSLPAPWPNRDIHNSMALACHTSTIVTARIQRPSTPFLLSSRTPSATVFLMTGTVSIANGLKSSWLGAQNSTSNST